MTLQQRRPVASALLFRLVRRGVVVDTDGHRIICRPADRVTAEERRIIEAHRAELVRLVQRRAEIRRELVNLVARTSQTLRDTERVLAVVSDEDARQRWGAAAERWRDLDHLVRELYGVAGHIGPGDRCPGNTEVRCEGCRTPAPPEQSEFQRSLFICER